MLVHQKQSIYVKKSEEVFVWVRYYSEEYSSICRRLDILERGVSFNEDNFDGGILVILVLNIDLGLNILNISMRNMYQLHIKSAWDSIRVFLTSQ